MSAASIEEALALQAAHERRLADYLAHEILAAVEKLRVGLTGARLSDLISVAEALGISPKLPPDWRTKREREIAALEEDAAALEKEAADLRARARAR